MYYPIKLPPVERKDLFGIGTGIIPGPESPPPLLGAPMDDPACDLAGPFDLAGPPVLYLNWLKLLDFVIQPDEELDLWKIHK